MHDLDVVILTAKRYERPADPDSYTRQVLHEDGLVRSALERMGMRTTRCDWARPDFDWSRTRSALLRTTWDYFHRAEAFARWLDRIEAQTLLVNDPALVRWNLDKRYLADLEAEGVRVVPTHVIERGSAETLPALLDGLGWREAVLKPVVSGAARETYRVTRDAAQQHEATLRRLVAREDMLLQPFQPAVVADGELSLVVIDGRFTHAVRKTARPGDFRVQDDHGGTVHAHTASPDETAFAEAAVAACPRPPVYARVDVIRDEGGRPALMELELIEPELFFRMHPPAAEALADALAIVLGTPGPAAH
ncbi:MAG: ATP-grasp domain-containing protein [Planctomycetota bacterium]|jgi:glutathione synthase/RimK-type ligase-like ATP-grasp enzyme